MFFFYIPGESAVRRPLETEKNLAEAAILCLFLSTSLVPSLLGDESKIIRNSFFLHSFQLSPIPQLRAAPVTFSFN